MQKTVVVTGASRGLGLELCHRFQKLGYRVIAVVRNIPNPNSACFEQLSFVRADLSNILEVEILAKEVMEICNGHLDILVNNAGIGYHCRVQKVIATELSETFYVNTLSPIILISRLLPILQSADGHIVNVTSKLVSSNMAYTSVYTASKRALAGFSDVVRLETGIRITSVETGAMETDFLERTNDEPVKEFFSKRTLSRLDVASVAELIISAIGVPANTLVERIQVVPVSQVV